MMADLPQGWQSIRGVSCAGWDIRLAVAGPSNFSIWSRQCQGDPNTAFDFRGFHPTHAAGEKAIKRINDLIWHGEYRAEVLFEDQPLAQHPMFGVF